MTTAFYAWLYGRFIEIYSNLRRKILHRTNQGSGGSFNNRGNIRAPIQFRRETQPQHLKDDFSWRTDLSIFASIAAVLLDQSNKTNQVFPALKWTVTFCLSSQCLVDQIHIQKPTLLFVTDQIPDHTERT